MMWIVTRFDTWFAIVWLREHHAVAEQHAASVYFVEDVSEITEGMKKVYAGWVKKEELK